MRASSAGTTRRLAGRRRRGRPTALGNDFDTRAALLRAAHEVLEESGGKPVPLAAICQRAGVDVAMVSYHFGSKRGLMVSLFERICASFAPELDSLLALPASSRRKLEIHVGAIVRNFQRYPYVTQLMTDLIMSSDRVTAKRLAESFARPLTAFYQRLFAQGLSSKELRRVDPMYFFFSIVGACEFLFAARPLLAAAFGIAQIDAHVERKYVAHTAGLLLDGVSAAGPDAGKRIIRREEARMESLAAATAAFVLTHFVSSTPLRPALVAALGEWPYRGLYSLVAAVTLVWMIWAYAQAPRTELLWTPLRLVPLLAMPFALILVVAGYWRNPTMVGADRLLKSDDPARGMIRITRHPLMWGIMLWSGAHILARADLDSIVFFGGFFVLAALGTVSIDFRKRSDPDFRRFAAVTSNVPFVAILQGRNRIAWREIGWLRPAIGLALFAALFLLHPWLFGARPY